MIGAYGSWWDYTPIGLAQYVYTGETTDDRSRIAAAKAKAMEAGLIDPRSANLPTFDLSQLPGAIDAGTALRDAIFPPWLQIVAIGVVGLVVAGAFAWLFTPYAKLGTAAISQRRNPRHRRRHRRQR